MRTKDEIMDGVPNRLPEKPLIEVLCDIRDAIVDQNKIMRENQEHGKEAHDLNK